MDKQKMVAIMFLRFEYMQFLSLGKFKTNLIHTFGGLRTDFGRNEKLSLAVMSFVGGGTVPQFVKTMSKKVFKCWREKFSKAVPKSYVNSVINCQI
jgi:hypothetical protein